MNGVQMCDLLEFLWINFYVKILLTHISLSFRVRYPYLKTSRLCRIIVKTHPKGIKIDYKFRSKEDY